MADGENSFLDLFVADPNIQGAKKAAAPKA